MLIGNHRGNGIYWPRRLQLLLGHLSATKATGCHTEEQVNVWHEVTTGWYCGYCGSVCGHGLLAAGQLVFTVWTRAFSSTLEAVILEVSATSAAQSSCNTPGGRGWTSMCESGNALHVYLILDARQGRNMQCQLS